MFEPMMEEMKLRNYSPKTINIYCRYNYHFLSFCRKQPQQVTAQDLRKYLLHLIEIQYSSSAVNLAHNALNFYYRTIMKRAFTIPFQKREQRILEEATPEELRQILAVTRNPKHHLLISLLYAAGVRVSEVVRIKLEHCNLEKRLLLVSQGKGKKDRYTILSAAAIQEIKDYLAERLSSSSYLFASSSGHICEKTAEEILTQARKKAGLSKTITPHTLRRSFVTHHREIGTPWEYLQSMLGHKDIRTTRAYQRLSSNYIQSVQSPHDFL